MKRVTKCSYKLLFGEGDLVEVHPCWMLVEGMRGLNGNVVGITQLHVFDTETGKSYYGPVMNKATNKKDDRGMAFNFCPFCGERIMRERESCS